MIRNFYFSLKKYLLEKSSKFTKSRLAYPFIFVLCFLVILVAHYRYQKERIYLRYHRMALEIAMT